MTISIHADVFAGQPVRPYDPADAAPHAGAYRLTVEYDSERRFPELLDDFLAKHGGRLTALVVGSWGDSQDGGSEVVQALVAAKDRMPGLTALYLGDITYEECEMSWIQHGDISELLPAFPRMEEFRVRGTTGLRFGRLTHAALKSFAVESGGLDAEIINEVLAADFPHLTHLELWLGEPNYGGVEDTAILAPLLAGGLFPKLTSLGLRNCRIQDAVAKKVAASKILKRLERLDLSLGNLGDEGAAALVAAPAVKKLTSLDLHHHYLSDEMSAKLQAMGIPVDLSDGQGGDADPDDRYITVGE